MEAFGKEGVEETFARVDFTFKSLTGLYQPLRFSTSFLDAEDGSKSITFRSVQRWFAYFVTLPTERSKASK